MIFKWFWSSFEYFRLFIKTILQLFRWIKFSCRPFWKWYQTFSMWIKMSTAPLIGSNRLFPMCDFFCPWNWRCEINQDHYYREDWNHQTNHWKYSKIWLSTLRGSIFRLNELGFSNIIFFILTHHLWHHHKI